MSACLASAVLVIGVPAAAAQHAQERRSCIVLCTPELDLEPTVTVENLFAPPRIQNLSSGGIRRLGRGTAFEAILSVGVPTELPYIGLTFEAIVAPFADDNSLEFEGELNLVFLRSEWTRGWLEAHFDIIDKFSPAERPAARRAYTHKLNLEVDLALAAFAWLPPEQWLRNIEAEISLDYVATGLPRRGDVVDGERFLDDASPWSLSLLLVIPVAPLAR